tara:strand:- start:1832 stop:2827 length:996 start_codon:yes stop_codon:yes gene_type:complete
MIKSSAPTRIDLAGGTLDIWPIYHLLGNPPTLNAAISLFAKVQLSPLKGKSLVVESLDLNLKAKFTSVDTLPNKHPLALILETIRFYRPKGGLKITTHCQAPAGSGIGGSSALAIALNGALNKLTDSRYNRHQMLEIARNVETSVIRVPGGWQDFFPASYGGVREIKPNMARVESFPIPLDLKLLTKRFVLCFTGKPRQSGINNWEVMKKVLDGNHHVWKKLNGIGDIARKMEKELRKGAVESIARLLNEEWELRKSLAAGITTPEMNHLILIAKKNGALAAKVCGAGGGGCIAFFVEPGAKARVENALNKNKGNVLTFHFVKRGMMVQND